MGFVKGEWSEKVRCLFVFTYISGIREDRAYI